MKAVEAIEPSTWARHYQTSKTKWSMRSPPYLLLVVLQIALGTCLPNYIRILFEILVRVPWRLFTRSRTLRTHQQHPSFWHIHHTWNLTTKVQDGTEGNQNWFWNLIYWRLVDSLTTRRSTGPWIHAATMYERTTPRIKALTPSCRVFMSCMCSWLSNWRGSLV